MPFLKLQKLLVGSDAISDGRVAAALWVCNSVGRVIDL